MTDTKRLPTSSASSSATPTIHDESGVARPVDSDMPDKQKSEKTTTVPASQTDDDGTLVVNWEGPDDPENPKK